MISEKSFDCSHARSCDPLNLVSALVEEEFIFYRFESERYIETTCRVCIVRNKGYFFERLLCVMLIIDWHKEGPL